MAREGWRLRKGKLVYVIDTRPSKRMRAAQRRQNKQRRPQKRKIAEVKETAVVPLDETWKLQVEPVSVGELANIIEKEENNGKTI